MTRFELPHESFHWRMAVSTLFMGLLAAIILAQGLNGTSYKPGPDFAMLLGGASLLGAVLYAAYASGFWNHVRYLPQPQKALVWTAAIGGFVLLGIFWIVLVIAWNAVFDRD